MPELARNWEKKRRKRLKNPFIPHCADLHKKLWVPPWPISHLPKQTEKPTYSQGWLYNLLGRGCVTTENKSHQSNLRSLERCMFWCENSKWIGLRITLCALFAVLPGCERLVAVWLLFLLPAGLHRNFLHTHVLWDAQPQKGHADCTQWPYETGIHSNDWNSEPL